MKSKAKLEAELWPIFSEVMRLRGSENGYNGCYTCDLESVAKIQYLDAGHLIDSRYPSLRFDERNVKPQCHNCNRLRDSDPFMLAIFERRLKKEYGKNVIKELEAKKHQPGPDKLELIEMIANYKAELKQLNETW